MSRANVKLNEREIATIVAALRYWVREGIFSGGHEQDIATNGGAFEALTPAEVTELCERRLNLI